MIRASMSGAFLILAGCTVNPSVRYIEANSAADIERIRPSLIDSFYFQETEIRIEFRNISESGKPTSYSLVVTPSQREDSSRRIMVLREDPLWSRTNLTFTKIENTDLVATAGVEVQDRRVEFLQNAGAIIKTIAPLVMGADGKPRLGCVNFPAQACELNATELIPSGDGAKFKDVGSAADPTGLEVQWGKVPATALRAEGAFAAPGRKANGLYYAACRDLAVTYAAAVTPATGQTPTLKQVYTWRGKVADPTWLEFAAFPRKGTIRMHSQCGVSTSSEKDPTQPLDAVINTAVVQTIAIKDALDKAAKDDKN
jgi:hypothetical protein